MDDRRLVGDQVARTSIIPERKTASSRTRPLAGVCGFVIVATACLCVSCEPSPNAAPPGPFIARIGVPEANLSTQDSGLRQIAGLFSMEGLTERGFDGRAVPRLAERWTTTPDGLRWRFTVRKGVAFHDGSPVTASEIVESLKRGVGARSRPGALPGLADVVSVTATAVDEVEITLRRRSTFLLEDLDYPIVRTAEGPVTYGTGAFKTIRASESEIVMDRHDSYYGGRPELERIVIRPYATVRTGWASLMRGEIDVLVDLSRDAAEFVGSSDVALYPYLRRYVYVIALNGRRALFSTPVRRALNAAIDRDALIRNTLRGQGLPASGPLWPHHWAYDGTLRGYAFDPSLAGAALDAAGHRPTTTASGRRSRFSFTCLVPQNWLIWERVAIDVQKQLYDVNVDMQLQMVTAEEYDKRLRSGDFDAVVVEMMSGPTFSRPYAFWHWGNEQTVYNVFGYRNPTSDRWWDAIRSAPSDAEYRAAAGELQRTMLDDPPALFLAWSRRVRAITRRFNIPIEEGRDPMTAFWRATRNTPRTAAH